jgi:hypothetical protein
MLFGYSVVELKVKIRGYNARIAIGDTVNIRKINAIYADKITIKPLTAMAITKSSLIDERYLCDATCKCTNEAYGCRHHTLL